MSDAGSPDETDAQLARRAATGPNAADAFAALFARHHARLLAFLLARFPDIAEDVASEAWLRVLGVVKTGGRDMPNFRGFLFEIARNLALDSRRRKRGESLDDATDPPAVASDALENLLDTERRDVVSRCRDKLPADQRAVIEAAASGEKPTEIATRLRVAREIVDQRKSRGLAALRECVKKNLP